MIVYPYLIVNLSDAPHPLVSFDRMAAVEDTASDSEAAKTRPIEAVDGRDRQSLNGPPSGGIKHGEPAAQNGQHDQHAPVEHERRALHSGSDHIRQNETGKGLVAKSSDGSNERGSICGVIEWLFGKKRHESS